MAKRKLYRNGVQITDEQTIRNQVAEKKQTGSFQTGVTLGDSPILSGTSKNVLSGNESGIKSSITKATGANQTSEKLTSDLRKSFGVETPTPAPTGNNVFKTDALNKSEAVTTDTVEKIDNLNESRDIVSRDVIGADTIQRDDLKNKTNIQLREEAKNMNISQGGSIDEKVRQPYEDAKNTILQNYKRSGDDYALSIEQTEADVNFSLETSHTNMNRNLNSVLGNSALAGGNNSALNSNYDTIKADSQRMIDRIKDKGDIQISELQKGRTRLGEDYQRNIKDITKQQEDAVNEATFQTILSIQAIDNAVGTTSKEGKQQIEAIWADYTKNMQNAAINSENLISASIANTNKELDLLDRVEELSYIENNENYKTFSSAENLGNENISSMLDFVDNYITDPTEIDSQVNKLVDTSVNNTVAGIEQALSNAGIVGYGFENSERIRNAILNEGKTGQEIGQKIISEVYGNPAKLQELKTRSLDETTRLGIEALKLGNEGKRLSNTKTIDEISANRPSSVGINSLLDQISIAEGTGGNYNAVYGNGGQSEVSLVDMTLDELKVFQKNSVYQDKSGNYVGGAMGKYQIVTGTLQAVINQMGLSGNEKFTPELQDRMAVHLLGSTVDDYKAGRIDEAGLQKKLSQVWASIPNPATGKSTYASDGTNGATKGGHDIMNAILGLKNDSKQKPVEGFNDFDAPLYSKFLSGKLTATDQKGIDNLAEFKKQAQNYQDSLIEQGTPQIHKLISLATDLRDNSPGRASRMLSDTGAGRVASSDLSDFKAKFDAFISNSALDNLVELKNNGATFGALSDNELKFIQNAATSLQLNLSDDAFTGELDRIIEKLQAGLGNTPQTTTQTTPQNTNTGYSIGGTTLFGGNENDDLLSNY